MVSRKKYLQSYKYCSYATAVLLQMMYKNKIIGKKSDRLIAHIMLSYLNDNCL